MDNIKTTGAAKGAAKSAADVYGKPGASPKSVATSAPASTPASPTEAKSFKPKIQKAASILPPSAVKAVKSPAQSKPSTARMMNDIAEIAVKQGLFAPAQTKIDLKTVGVATFPEVQLLTVGETKISVNARVPQSVFVNIVEWAVNIILAGNNYVSAPMAAMTQDFAVLKCFTNIDLSFIDKSTCTPEEFYAAYDIVKTIMPAVRAALDVEQSALLKTHIEETVTSVLEYRRSAVGIVDQLAARNSDDSAALESALKVISEGEQSDDIQTLLKAFQKLS